MEKRKVEVPDWFPNLTAWNRLTWGQQKTVIEEAAKKGIYDLKDVRNYYNSLAEGGEITYSKPYYSYDENGNRLDDTLNYNATLPEVIITPDSRLDAAERNYRERLRQKNLRDYEEQKDRETTEFIKFLAQRQWENSPQKKAIDLGIEVAQGIGMASDVTSSLFGGIPAYSGLKGAQALDNAIQSGEVRDYVDAGLWLSPMLTVAGKKVYDTAKPAITNVFKKNTPAKEWATRQTDPTLHSRSNTLYNNESQEVEPDYLFIGQSLLDAKKYKASEGYKELARRAGEESEAMGIGGFPPETFTTVNEDIPKITFSKRIPGDKGGYSELTNTIDLDLQQSLGLEVPYHEGLHWQRVGIPSIEIGSNYERYLESVKNDAPLNVREALIKKYKQTPEKERLGYREKAMEYLQEKTNEVLVDDYPLQEYMRNPQELQAHGNETGRALGIKPFSPYPGYSKVKDIIKKAREYDDNLEYIKAETPEEVENFWKILTGNYIPATTGGIFISKLKED